MSSFTSPLIVSPLPNGRDWKVVKPFVYHIGSRHSRKIIKIKRGFITDFASTDVLQWIASLLVVIYATLIFLVNVPDWVGLLFLVVILAGLLITPYSKANKAAAIHDYLYKAKIFTRKKADKVFREAMCVCNVEAWRCISMYYAVRLCGWLAWKKKRENTDGL